MAAKATSNIRKIFLGVCLCTAAGLGQFFLMGSSPERDVINQGSREATVTLTRTKRLTQTPAPRFTLTKTVILETYEQIRATEGSLFFDCGWANRRINSDDSEWTAVQCVGNDIGVYKPKDLSKTYYIKYFDVYGKEYQNGNHYGNLWPVQFSNDHQSFFFSPYQVGDGGCPAYGWYYALFKLNLKTGAISNQVSPEEKTGFNFAFSNDDKYLAYLYSNLALPNLHIQDLKNNIQTVIPIDGAYSEAGSIIWSPDNSQLIFSARTGEDYFDMDYYVVSINLKNFNQKVIVQEKNLAIFPLRWVDDEHILVRVDHTREPTNIEYSILNITTGELEPESHPEAIPAGLAF